MTDVLHPNDGAGGYVSLAEAAGLVLVMVAVVVAAVFAAVRLAQT